MARGGCFSGGRAIAIEAKAIVMTHAGTELQAPRPEAARRLHNVTYAVVYPAFLGSFIVSLLLAPPATSAASLGWGLLLAAYFTLQQIEGALSGDEEYGFRRFVIDIGEIALMIAAFDSLKLVRPDPDSAPIFGYRFALEHVLPAVFAYPALVRLGILGLSAVNVWKPKVQWRPNLAFYRSLTAMSLIAAVASYWHDSNCAFYLIVALLLFYLAFFQIGNDIFTNPSWRRPQSKTADRLGSLTQGASQAASDASLAAQEARTAAAAARKATKAAEQAAKAPGTGAGRQPAPAMPAAKRGAGGAGRKATGARPEDADPAD